MSKMLIDGMDMKDIGLSVDKIMARPVGNAGKFERLGVTIVDEEV